MLLLGSGTGWFRRKNRAFTGLTCPAVLALLEQTQVQPVGCWQGARWGWWGLGGTGYSILPKVQREWQ